MSLETSNCHLIKRRQKRSVKATHEYAFFCKVYLLNINLNFCSYDDDDGTGHLFQMPSLWLTGNISEKFLRPTHTHTRAPVGLAVSWTKDKLDAVVKNK
jgi:hypothetical protein